MEQILFENNFYSDKVNEVEIVEAEPSTGGSTALDVAKTERKSGFSKATLSKTLPALVGFVQPLNNPTGYVFGFRPKGAAGSDPHAVQTITTESETQGGVTTTTTVSNPIAHDTAEDFMITRKTIETGLREVKIDMTTSVEQDVLALFGGHFENKYHTFMDPSTTGKVDKVATFFFEYATTQMVKKTNKAFTDYLATVATDLGDATITDLTNGLGTGFAQMQSALMKGRNKLAGRFWVICSPEVAGAVSTLGDIYNGKESEKDLNIGSEKNTYVCTMGNMDVYMSPDVAAGDIYMGILGNANVSSIYYNPYSEYMINGGADPYTGINNIFFRARDAWSTNPVDSFGDTQPVATTNNEIVESAASDYVVKANITVTPILV